MNKFIKLIAAPLLIIIALALLITPYVIGYSLENEVRSYKDRIPPNAGYDLVVQDYHRGWFTSTANIVLKLNMGIKPQNKQLHLPETVEITFTNVIHHGPIIFSGDTNKFTFARAFIESKISNPDIPMNFSALWKFGGGMLALANADKASFNLNNGGETHFIIQGLAAKQLTKHDYNNIDTRFLLAGLDAFDKNQGHLEVLNVSHESTFQKIKHAFWSGKSETKIGNVKLVSDKNDQFEMQAFSMTQTSGMENDRANGNMSVSIGSIKINDHDYGNQTLSISVSNMDVESLNEFTSALEDQSQKNLPLLPFGKTYRAMLTFLGKGLNLSLDNLDINSKWGRIKANAEIDLKQNAANLESLQEVIHNIKVNANVIVPEKFMNQIVNFYLLSQSDDTQKNDVDPAITQKQLDTWIESGWVVRDQENFQLKLKIENAKIFINDKPFEFPAKPPTLTAQPVAAPATAPAATAPSPAPAATPVKAKAK